MYSIFSRQFQCSGGVRILNSARCNCC